MESLTCLSVVLHHKLRGDAKETAFDMRGLENQERLDIVLSDQTGTTETDSPGIRKLEGLMAAKESDVPAEFGSGQNVESDPESTMHNCVLDPQLLGPRILPHPSGVGPTTNGRSPTIVHEPFRTLDSRKKMVVLKHRTRIVTPESKERANMIRKLGGPCDSCKDKKKGVCAHPTLAYKVALIVSVHPNTYVRVS